MARYEFCSVFAEEIRKYISEKVSAGFKEASFRSHLMLFDKFCNNRGITEPVFTQEDAAAWAMKKDSEVHTTHYARINASKQFLIYLSLKGYDVHVVRDVKFKGTDFEPHIYTEEETARYFRAVDEYSNNYSRKDALQYPVLFRIFYCCGTRLNETLRIKKKDVDLDKGIIRLIEAKNNRERYVVCGEDLRQLLNIYADRCFYLLKDDDYIFSNRNGGLLNEKVLYENHRMFLSKAGIPYIGNNEGPRIHDWRHHMAVYSFKQLVDSGLDMYVALPILSTYLGHKTILATERYVRLTMQLFPYIEEKFRDKVDQIFGGDLLEEH